MSVHQQLNRRLHRKRVALDDGLVARVPGPDPTSSNADGTPTAPSTNTAPAGSGTSRGPMVRTSATPSPTTAAPATSSQEQTSQATTGNTSSRNTSAGRSTGSGTTADSNTDTDTDTAATGTSNTRTQAQNSRSAASGSLTVPVLSSSGPHTSFVSQTLSSAEPSTTADEPTNSSGATNAAAIIGGIVAFIIGVVILTFAVRKLVSLKRRRNEEPDEFDASEFRRSAVLINDPPNHSDTISRGYNPRPPTMLERKLNRSPTFVHQSRNDGAYDGFSDYPPLPPQQPNYPEPAYISPIANPATAGIGSPFESTFAIEQNPYVTQQNTAGAAGVGAYGADFAAGSHTSQATTPVTTSFESPAMFAPMNTDNEPLYSPTHRQEFDKPVAMVGGIERPSEEYVRAAAVNGYTLPSDTHGA